MSEDNQKREVLPSSPSAFALARSAEQNRSVVAARGEVKAGYVAKHHHIETTKDRAADERHHVHRPTIKIEDVEGLQTKLRGMKGSDGWDGPTYIFTACVDGTPKSFVIPIISGPT